MASTILESLRSVLRKSKPTAAQLTDAVDLARRNEVDAIAAVERAAKVVAAGFMDDPAKRQADRAALAEARLAAEDATLTLAETERRHTEALAADEQARRQAVYGAAQAKADAAAATLARTYPKAVRDLLSTLKELAEAQQAVVTANDQLPDGADLLLDPELVARGAAGQNREIVSDEWVELWGRQDLDTPTDDQNSVTDYGKGWGKRVGDVQPCYRKRLFRKVTYKELVGGSYPTPLAATLQLPELTGDRLAWGEIPVGFNPALAAVAQGRTQPGVVLHRLAEIETAAVAKPVKVDRPIKVEWLSHVDVHPLPDGPAPTYSGNGRNLEAQRGRFSTSPFAPAR